MDKWVMRGAISLLKQFQEDTDEANDGVHFCVKLSAGTLLDKHFYPWLKMLFESAKLKSPKLILEFDTYHCIAHETQVLDLIEIVKKNYEIKTMLSGMHYIDQYRNMSKKLSFNYIKVNINHINNLSHEEILSWLSEIHAKGDHVICSGLEKADALTYTMRLPFDYLQGYLIQKPSPNTFQVNMDWLQL